MKKVFYISIVVIIVFITCSCSQKAENGWQAHYDLGIRYLSEGNYEEAILAFTKVIEIDPKNVDAYIGLADAYLAMGDTDSAKEILEKARANCGDNNAFDRLADKLGAEEITVEPIETETASYVYKEGDGFSKLLEAGDSGNLLTGEEVLFCGEKLYTLSASDIYNLAQTNGLGDENLHVEINEHTTEGERCDIWYKDSLFLEAHTGTSRYNYYSYTGNGFYDGDGYIPPLSVGIRNIKTGDSLETVLSEIGFTNADVLAEKMYEAMNKEYETEEELESVLALETVADGHRLGTSRNSYYVDDAEYTALGHYIIHAEKLDNGRYIPKHISSPTPDMAFNMTYTMLDVYMDIGFFFKNDELNNVRIDVDCYDYE